ncbi:MAG: hypothetical protein M1133_03005 [Armatimonadetes bacterium]|nr:hypothetical protein [Armatimonadota bacterium]
MSLRINLNTAALGAHRTLSGTSDALGKSIERLSSGYRINNAGDDPAGLVISEKLRAQVSGLGQAIKNAGDAVNMVKTAEGALSEVHRLLRSMRDLAVHAANTGATDSASAQADQSQITNAINSLNKIASETQFGGKKLLDGSAGIKTFINGSNVMSGDFSFANGIINGADIKVEVSTAAEKATLASSATYSELAAGTVSSTATYAGTSTVLLATGCVSIGGTNITYTSGTTTVAVLMASINAESATTGVSASFDTTTNKIKLSATTSGAATTFYATDTATAGTDLFADGSHTGVDWGNFATATGSLYVNGVKIDYSSGDNANTFINNVNAKTSLTGVEASYNTTTNKIDFNSTTYGSAATVNVTTGAMFLGTGTANSSDAGVNAVAKVTQTSAGSTTNVSDNTWTAGSGLTVKDSLGNQIVLTEAGGSATSAASSQFTVEKNTLTFHVGAFANQTRDVNIAAAYSHNLGNGAVANANISTMDVTTSTGAQNAIKIIDQAITDVSNIRSSLGATQVNVLESSVNSLSVAKEMISASESTIRDTDMAAEMIQFTKLQMLNQAGTAMLAQANSAPQQLLSLLRG